MITNEDNRAVLSDYNHICVTYNLIRFPSNGIHLNLDTSVLNAQEKILLICSILNDSDLVEILFVIEKLHHFEINVLLTYFAFSRTEVGVDFIANLLKNVGVNNVISIDMHTTPHKYISNINVEEFWESFIDNKYLIVAPDKGAILRNKSLYHLSLSKERQDNKIIITDCEDLYDIKNKDCAIVDDMIDTGKTAIAASDFLMENGAKSVIVCATHAVLSEGASQHLQDSKSIEKIFMTDTIMHEKLQKKYSLISIFGYAIDICTRRIAYKTQYAQQCSSCKK
jgi:ribose-phosphate pyrophosphokinase